jgi:hypothetical protein
VLLHVKADMPRLLCASHTECVPVIVACVGLVSEGQEQIIPRKYARDVVFYLISVVYLCVVFFDGVVRPSQHAPLTPCRRL